MKVILYTALLAVGMTVVSIGLVLAFLWLAPDEVVRCG